MEIKMSRKELIEQLYGHVLQVTFTKVNGDNRVMDCTLIPEMLPTPRVVESDTKVTRKVNEKTISVWDLNAKGWRSFRVDNVTNMEVIADTIWDGV